MKAYSGQRDRGNLADRESCGDGLLGQCRTNGDNPSAGTQITASVEERSSVRHSDPANHRQRYPEHAGARQFAGQPIYSERAGRSVPVPSSDREAYRSINAEVSARTGQSGELQGAFHAESEGNKVSVLYAKSEYNGWTYVSVVSLDKVTDQTGNIALITAAACFGIILTVLITSWFGSRRMYSPIRKLHEFATNVQPQQTDDSRKDEFEFIRESLTSLAVSRNELDKQMKSQTVHLREFYVLKLFTEQMSGADDRYASERYGFPTGWEVSACCSLSWIIFSSRGFRNRTGSFFCLRSAISSRNLARRGPLQSDRAESFPGYVADL